MLEAGGRARALPPWHPSPHFQRQSHFENSLRALGITEAQFEYLWILNKVQALSTEPKLLPPVALPGLMYYRCSHHGLAQQALTLKTLLKIPSQMFPPPGSPLVASALQELHPLFLAAGICQALIQAPQEAHELFFLLKLWS